MGDGTAAIQRPVGGGRRTRSGQAQERPGQANGRLAARAGWAVGWAEGRGTRADGQPGTPGTCRPLHGRRPGHGARRVIGRAPGATPAQKLRATAARGDETPLLPAVL
jgi:hypothetical protein